MDYTNYDPTRLAMEGVKFALRELLLTAQTNLRASNLTAVELDDLQPRIANALADRSTPLLVLIELQDAVTRAKIEGRKLNR